MKFSELKVGLKLEMVLLRNDGTRMNIPFVSELEWVEASDILFIAAPIYEGRLYPIQVGRDIAVSFILDSNFYEFTAKVIARESKENLAILKIQTLSQINKIQRREFFRFEANLPIRYRIFESANSKSNQEFIEAVTRDISGGGLCIRLIEPVEMDKYIECELILSTKVKFIGKVVRLTEYDTLHGQYKYEIGVSYKNIDEPMREKIISYIFQEQRRLLKKG